MGHKNFVNCLNLKLFKFKITCNVVCSLTPNQGTRRIPTCNISDTKMRRKGLHTLAELTNSESVSYPFLRISLHTHNSYMFLGIMCVQCDAQKGVTLAVTRHYVMCSKCPNSIHWRNKSTWHPPRANLSS